MGILYKDTPILTYGAKPRYWASRGNWCNVWRRTEIDEDKIQYHREEITILVEGEIYSIKIIRPKELLVSYSWLTQKKSNMITLEDLLSLGKKIWKLDGILIKKANEIITQRE